MPRLALRAALLALLTLPLGHTLAAEPAPPTEPAPRGDAPAGEPVDFTADGEALARVVACLTDEGPLPEGVRAASVRAHCRSIDRSVARYVKRWLPRAQPFFAEHVPDDLPTTVVYPFGGADLTNALTVFPDAAEITTISLEYSGDPRTIRTHRGAALDKSLRANRDFIAKLMAVNHNRTLDLAVLDSDALPAPLAFALVGLKVHDRELVRVRYFTLDAAGDVVYLDAAAVAAADAAIAAERSTARARDAANEAFAHVEVTFRRAGAPDAPLQVFRHIRANLADDHFPKGSPLDLHLRKKGRVSAMTKAASYLLHRPAFSNIRDYLLENMAWMISDSTGPAPFDAEPAGFEQLTWGRFDGLMFHGTREGERAMRDLFKKNPYQPISFFFGYPDKNNQRHLVITRPRAAGTP